MKRFCKQMAGTAGLLFILAACSNNSSSYPEEYVGFEKATKNYSFDKNKDTEEFDVKIIAAEKKNEDREVLINGINMPGKAAIFSIENKTVIIPAKKKSANLRVKIYPKRVTDKAEFRNIQSFFQLLHQFTTFIKLVIFMITCHWCLYFEMI